jgi:rubredoxin
MSAFDEKKKYTCPDCGYTELVSLHGWGAAPEKLKCPECYGMMEADE